MCSSKKKRKIGFESSAKKLLTAGFKSPSKTSFLIKHFEQKGLKVDFKEERVEVVSDCDEFKSSQKKKFSLLQLKSFRQQNRCTDHKAMVDEILLEFGRLNKAAQELGVLYCTLYNLCRPLEPKTHKRTEQKKENESVLREFYELKSTTTTFPHGRLANKMFMSSTYKESHQEYVKWCEEKGIPPLSESTFYRLKPNEVYKLANMPDNMCVCILCQHFKMDRRCIEENNIKGVSAHTRDILLDSMCPVTDAMQGVSKEYGQYSCISQECQVCGTTTKWGRKCRSSFYESKIKKENPGIYQDRTVIKWQRWEYTTRLSKDGRELKNLNKVDKFGTKKQFLQVFLDDVHDMSLHVFNWKWHDKQFEYIKNNLKVGMLVSVLDFAQNYMNLNVDEPQGAHWDHTQTVIHPIVNYRLCPKDGRLITEEHIIISDDLLHDKFAVRDFERASVNNLISSGFTPTSIIQFCDNCSSQYKSKGPFQYISMSETPVVRNYFGANHGKGPSDAATGRVKMALTKAKKSRKHELRTAREVYDYLQVKFAEWEEDRLRKAREKNKCMHFFQKVFFVTDVDRSEKIEAVTTGKSSKFSCVRSTGTDFIVEARNVACLCPKCCFGEDIGCPNSVYCGEWKQYDLRSGKQNKELVTSHWVNCNLERSAEAIVHAASHSHDHADHDNSTVSVNNTESVNNNINNDICQPFDWQSLYNAMQSCVNFDSLHNLLSTVSLPPLNSEVALMSRQHRIDSIAMQYIPHDAPNGFLPVCTFGDGNCFPRALATSINMNEHECHKEMRIRICHEGVINKNRYLDSSYLAKGCANTYSRTTFPIVYADMSEYRVDFGCIEGESRDNRIARWSVTAEQIYKREVYMSRKSGEYMGMWQIFQAANCIGRPITSVYPNMFSEKFRNDVNRIVYPFDERLRNNETVYIMWTPSIGVTDDPTQQHRPNHFVPMLQCMYC